MHPAPTKPLPEHVVRANRAGFSARMWKIIKLANSETDKMIAKNILMRSNGKHRSSDHFKWEKLKKENYPILLPKLMRYIKKNGLGREIL